MLRYHILFIIRAIEGPTTHTHTRIPGLLLRNEAIHHLSFVYGFPLLYQEPHPGCGLSNLISFYTLHHLRSATYRAHHKIPLAPFTHRRCWRCPLSEIPQHQGSFSVGKTQQHLQAAGETQESQALWDWGVLLVTTFTLAFWVISSLSRLIIELVQFGDELVRRYGLQLILLQIATYESYYQLLNQTCFLIFLRQAVILSRRFPKGLDKRCVCGGGGGWRGKNLAI